MDTIGYLLLPFVIMGLIWGIIGAIGLFGILLVKIDEWMKVR